MLQFYIIILLNVVRISSTMADQLMDCILAIFYTFIVIANSIGKHINILHIYF